MIRFTKQQWAVVLGGSSGFGLASAKKLAAEGMSVFIVHRDRRGAMERIERDFDQVRAHGNGFASLNADALSPEGLAAVLDGLAASLGPDGKVRVLLHSIAYGNLKPIVRERPAPAPPALARLADALGLAPADMDAAVDRLAAGGEPIFKLFQPVSYGDATLDDEDMARTIFSMGTSLLSWVQRIHAAGLFAPDARVIGLTSEGNAVAWRGYAAVAAAKSALESVSRAIAVEFAPYGIRSNIVQPGVTDTPALRLIPGSDLMKAGARRRNPFGRLTTPEDVADVVFLLSLDEARWINGALIRADGGEHVA